MSKDGTAPPLPASLQHLAGPKRERVIVNRTPEDDLEGAVMREVGDMLAEHPLVLLAVRQNTGKADRVAADGSLVPVWFFRWIRRPMNEQMKLPDYWGLLTDGKFFGIECKHRHWLFNPNNEREVQQKRFMAAVLTAGHRAGFATHRRAAEIIIEGQ